MEIVEQYAKLSRAIVELERQAEALRQELLQPWEHLPNTQSEAVGRRQTQRVLRTEMLPPEILNDSSFWDVASSDQADVRPLGSGPAFIRPTTAARVDLLRYRC